MALYYIECDVKQFKVLMVRRWFTLNLNKDQLSLVIALTLATTFSTKSIISLVCISVCGGYLLRLLR